MPGTGKWLSIVYDSHGRGQAAPKGNLVFVKPKKRKEFLSLGFIVVWLVLDGVPKGLRELGVHGGGPI